MANDFDSQLKAHIQAFTDELTALVRQAALATLQEAFGSTPTRRRRPSPPERAVAVPFAGPSAGGRQGGKRSAEELEELTQKFLAYVSGNPGLRIEAIAQGMGVTTRELNLPVKKLLATRQLRTKGQRRATEYFAR